jgi:hypothetical protein
MRLPRRTFFLAAPAALTLAAFRQAPRLYGMEVSKDVTCGCCSVWVERMRESGRFRVNATDRADMAAFKRSVGLPPALASCHTAIVMGYVIEGHVPAADIIRLIDQKPKGVVGLAVPGMPRGSPGMEMRDGSRDAYKVLAFKADDSTHVFASYPGA